MKVIIDISPLKSKHKTRGVGIYTRRLVEAINTVDKNNQYILTTKSKDISDVDIIHYPYFDLYFQTLPLRKKTKTVVTVHDVIPVVFPEQFPPGIRGRIKYQIQKYALTNTEAIITDSINSKKDITRYLNIDKENIHVVYLAADKVFFKENQRNLLNAKKKYKLPEKFISYVGDVNFNKNLPKLIKAFAIIEKKHRDLFLLMISKAFANKNLPELKELCGLIEKYNLSEKVLMKANIPLDPSDDLAAIYKLSLMYIQPSLYEGFGLPILEAFASGTPVVASNSSSIPEIVGNCAIMVNPQSIQDIANGIKKALNLSQEERDKIIKLGKLQAKKFSWEKTAKETITIYKKVFAKQ